MFKFFILMLYIGIIAVASALTLRLMVEAGRPSEHFIIFGLLQTVLAGFVTGAILRVGPGR